VPDRRPGNVPPCRHRAEAPAPGRGEKLGAFSRRLPADRARGAGGEIPGAGAGRPGRVHLDQVAQRHAPAPSRAPFRRLREAAQAALRVAAFFAAVLAGALATALAGAFAAVLAAVFAAFFATD